MIWEPALLDIVREETKPAFSGDKINVDYILNECPRFKGIWDETIRLTAFSSSVRYITDDTVIGGKILRKGNRLVIPYRQLHFDESVFGKGVSEFQSERFIKDPGLTRHASWRPFGGGATQCPGRFVAKQSVMTFVSIVLQRFDIEKSPTSQVFPRAEEGNPVLGLMDLKEGSDLTIKLSRRTASSTRKKAKN
jgi:cytochrome P450